MTVRCPTCRQPSGARGANRAFPFCSDRCRLLDMGRWLDGAYRIPGEPAGDAPPGGPAEGSGDPPVS